MSSLPASIKGLDKNNREKVVSQFSPFSPIVDICCHGNQISDPICTKTKWRLFLMFQIKFDCDWHNGLRDIDILKCEDTHAPPPTDGRTPALVPSYKLSL